ncbi:hypothetical protein KIN20_029459 [Parelaphostrongylus tenuis]|uniref:Uncharacterized protein n=1 Tax=Parelaphostrongylus tenuis TaxID=148309 RepID=A0AAD5WFI2_PARTN|nr:hypothetical protein KIN20_029459 [Parelaphostrongylus tenuis]
MALKLLNSERKICHMSTASSKGHEPFRTCYTMPTTSHPATMLCDAKAIDFSAIRTRGEVPHQQFAWPPHSQAREFARGN